MAEDGDKFNIASTFHQYHHGLTRDFYHSEWMINYDLIMYKFIITMAKPVIFTTLNFRIVTTCFDGKIRGEGLEPAFDGLQIIVIYRECGYTMAVPGSRP